MSSTEMVETLFPEYPEEQIPVDKSASEILDLVCKFGSRNLAYAGDSGSNPGYIFRGELDFEIPLQASLEREMRKQLCVGESLTGQQLREKEAKLCSTFFGDDGRRVAEIIDSQSGSRHSRPSSDVFWWVSVMQHYGHPTRFIDFTRDIRMALFFAVEHFCTQRRHGECSEDAKSAKDLIIYCFPCKDLKFRNDPDNNKSPIPFNKEGVVNLNNALGEQMGLEEFKDLQIEAARQRFGWDRPDYENPRLRFQKGMFVYPYEYPEHPLQKTSDSWLVQNLIAKADDKFGMRTHADGLPPKRIRIPSGYATDLQEHLKRECHLTTATVYVDYARVKLES